MPKKGGRPDKGGGGDDGGGDSGGGDALNLGAIAAKKNFKTFFDQPATGEEPVPWFDFRDARSAVTAQGSDQTEVITLSEYGDTVDMAGGDDYVLGNLGNDTLLGGDGNDYIWGETDGGFNGIDLSGASPSVGVDGNDSISGGAGNDELFGDARTLGPGAIGGNDVISGGDDNDLISGDGEYLYAATGGNDTIEGGAGNDLLWGDGVLDDASTGGADVFVFKDGSGDDVIFDYESGVDVIDLTGYSDPTLSAGDLAVFGGDKVLTLSGGDTITFYDAVAQGLDFDDISFA